MEFRQLKYFSQVANDQNYTIAAKKLFISQPTLSWTIKNLESDLGTKLFNYDGKRLCITYAGKVLLEHANHLIDEQQKVIEEIQNFSDIVRGHIKIGVPELFVFYMKSIMNFMEIYPEVKVTMVNNGSLGVQNFVNSEYLDLGFISNALVSNDFDVIELPHSYSIALIVNMRHHLSRKKSVSFSDLKNESIINFDEENYTLGKLTIEKCREAGFSPNIVLRSSEWDMIIEAVANSQSVSILPAPLIEKYHRNDIIFIPFKYPESTIPISLITKKNSPKSLPLEKFIQFLLDDIVNNSDYYHSSIVSKP